MHNRPLRERANGDKRKGLLAECAYNSIKKRILDRKVAPGDALVERKLASDLGISRTPIKLALSRLEQEGLVKTVPNTGTFVASITAADMASMYDIRELMEGLAARLLARRIAPGQAEELETLAAKADDESATLGDDEAFHSAIVEMCGDQRVHDIVKTWCLHVLTYDERTHRLTGSSGVHQFGAGRSAVEHRTIAKAIVAGNQAEAEDLVRRHVRHGKGVLARFLLGLNEE